MIIACGRAMSRSLNRAMLIGNVGADPDIRTAASGARVASFSLATSRRWSGAGGAEHEKTEWHRVVAWDALAELVARTVRRGDRLYVEGRLEHRSWEAPDGRKRYASEVIAERMLPLDERSAQPVPEFMPAQAERETRERRDDELPF